MAVRPPFIADREFVVARGFTFLADEFSVGDPFPKDRADARRLRLLYDSRAINFAPEREEGGEAAPARLVTIERDPPAFYLISAPWLDEPLRIRGKVKAEEAAAKLEDEGEPAHHHGVALTAGENGWWEVKADWADEAEKVHGEDAARERAAQLRKDGAPPAPPEVDERVTLIEGEADGPNASKFIVDAPWLEEPEIIDTREDADARQFALRDAGPPEGWTAPDA